MTPPTLRDALLVPVVATVWVALRVLGVLDAAHLALEAMEDSDDA